MKRNLYIILSLLIVLQLFYLKSLPYSTSLIKTSPIEQSGIVWDTDLFKSSPELQPFRDYFKEHCEGETGRVAALCVSEALQEIPWGAPPPGWEFLFPQYEPARMFAVHLKGEPGHCTTRSASLATILLSVGIPARLIQSSTHNAIEVWDNGWVVVDPSYPCVKVEMTPPFIYPEPWLYMRVGKRYSHFPFWGIFVNIGPWQWKLGPAQTTLRIGIVMCCLLLLGLLMRNKEKDET